MARADVGSGEIDCACFVARDLIEQEEDSRVSRPRLLIRAAKISSSGASIGQKHSTDEARREAASLW